MFKLNGIKIGAALLMLSSIANAKVIIDNQEILTEDIESITISPNSGHLFITTKVRYEVKPVGGDVTPPPPSAVSIGSFTASPDKFVAGGSTTLSWTTTNATSCAPSGGNSDWAGRTINLASGSANIPIADAGVYAFTLTCQSSAGATTTSNLTVTVIDESEPTATNCGASPLGGNTDTWQNFFNAAYPSTALSDTVGFTQPKGYKAIKFNTGTFTGKASITSPGITTTSGTRLLSVAECPGDFNVPKDCTRSFGTGGAVVWSTIAALRTCLLQPNTDYYVNVTYTDGIDPTQTTCGGACEFKLQHAYYISR